MAALPSTIVIEQPGRVGLEQWRGWARWLVQEAIPPEAVRWFASDNCDSGGGSAERANDLFAEVPRSTSPALAPSAPAVSLPGAFGALAETVAWHRGSGKWQVLYRLLWRLMMGDRGLLLRPSDEDVIAADRLQRAVRRDAHKMHAFVRFRSVADPVAPDGERFVAFHAPSHPIIRREATWFARRFAVMHWSIFTPDGSAAWDGDTLQFGPPADAGSCPSADAVEDMWLTYYRHIFNPSRLNPRAMQKEMPKKYWANLPEARLIPQLMADARSEITTKSDAAAPVPAEVVSLPQLAAAAETCRACGLCEVGTRVVFGEGPMDARVVLIGEQPGDQEDRIGRPFVGPAGQLLDEVLAEVGLDRGRVYMTNAVKHFSFELRGKRQIHQSPKVSEQRACRPWLDAELSLIKPAAVVCLGATAAKAVLGPKFRLTQRLGETQVSPWCDQTLATYHPAAILRMQAQAPDAAAAQHAQLRDDLARVRDLVA